MNIGIDIRSLMSPQRTGVGVYTEGLLSALFQEDTTNTYILFYNAHKDASIHIPNWEQDNVRYVRTNWPNKLFSMVQYAGIKPIDSFLREKLNYFFSPNLNFTAISNKTKHILTVHDLSFIHMPEYFSKKRQVWHTLVQPKKQIKHATHIITPSEQTKRDIRAWVGIRDEQITTIHPGIPQKKAITKEHQETIRKKYALPEKFFLMLGTVEPRKNIESVIDAYKKSRLFEQNYMFVIAGPRGWKEEAIIQKMQYTSGVQYIGFINEEDKQTIYSLAKVFIFPSFYEGFGFPVLEAMQQGTPVITSNRTSLPEIAEEAAYLVNPMNIDEIVQGIYRILDNKTMKERLIEQGYKQADKCTWEKTAKTFLEIVNTP